MNEKTERSTRAAEDRESTYVPLAIAVLSVQRTDQVKYVFVYIQKPRVSGLSDIRLGNPTTFPPGVVMGHGPSDLFTTQQGF